MARIVRLRPWHLRLIEPQQEQALLAAPQLNEPFGEAVLASGPCWACVDSERVYAAAGFVLEDERALAWAILGRDIGRHFIRVHRGVERALEEVKFKRVETFVRHGFENGQEWAQMLGFNRERICCAVGPDGSDYDEWVKANG